MTAWPAGYACAPNISVSSGDYSIRAIQWDDRETIRVWRNDQIDVLRQSEPLSVEGQDTYFAQVVASEMTAAHPAQILVAFAERDELIGYGGIVHIAWPDRRGEVSFLTSTSRADALQADWRAFLPLVITLAREELHLHRLTTECYAFRTDVIECLEGAGFVQEGRLSEQHLHDGEWIDALAHGLLLD